MPFSYAITRYGPKQLFLDAINSEAIKVRLTPTIKTAFLIIALSQKLSITNIGEIIGATRSTLYRVLEDSIFTEEVKLAHLLP